MCKVGLIILRFGEAGTVASAPRIARVRPVATTPQEGVIRDLVLLATVGIRPVLVHGGGPEINGWCVAPASPPRPALR